MKPGQRNTITDIEGLYVGHVEDASLKSGVTVLAGDRPLTAGVHVMGGAPGARETDLLKPDKLVQEIDALFLSGGSAFGLDAASGVMGGLRAAGRGFEVGAVRVPIVPGAILFDLLNGGDKDWSENPYRELGRMAFDNLSRETGLGTVGAGTGATTNGLKGGLGTASAELESGYVIGAIVAVNAVGSVVRGQSRHFWAAPFELGAEFGGHGWPAVTSAEKQSVPWPLAAVPNVNTTLAIVAVEASLDKAQLTRVAVAAHDGLARSIVPSHTPMDGDIVFAVSTCRNKLKDPMQDLLQIGHAASCCVARAVARGVFHATPADDDLIPTWQGLYGRDPG